jgi:hypothetical protein
MPMARKNRKRPDALAPGLSEGGLGLERDVVFFAACTDAGNLGVGF